MFPRGKRVSRANFPTLLLSRERRASEHLSATLASKPQGISVVVSKKVASSSVSRHLLKRRLLHILRILPHLLAPGVVVFARSGANKLSFKELKTELEEMFLQR